MGTYFRMLKMVRPYLAQVVLAIVFMVLFSFTSIFSVTMISPFLEALFLQDGAYSGETELLTEETPSSIGAIGAAGVATSPAGPEESDLQDGQQRALLEDWRQKADGLDALKYHFKAWVAGHLLQGSRQDALLRICLTFFFLVLAKNITGYIQEILMVYVGESVIRNLRNLLYLRFTSLPLAFYHKNKAGELISRATNDVLVAQKCVGVSFKAIFRDPIMIVMYLVVALLLSWKLTLIAVVLLPASLTIIIRIGKRLRKLSQRQQEQLADLTTTLQETIYGIRVIKAFAAEQHENNRFLAQSQDLFRQVFRINWVMKMSSPLTEQLSMIVGLFLLWYGGSKVFTGGIMAPDLFIVFLFCIFSTVRPLKSLGQVNNEIQAGMAAADRIFSILDTLPEVPDPEAGHPLAQVQGRVEFEHVHFGYLPGEPVLRDINLQVAPGEVVALVGSSGAGKSTLMDMIPGFYHPDQGRVLIDGYDARELSLASLRRQMGIVTQEVILFHDTVFNNIAYGLPGARLTDVQAAAGAANAEEFIAGLPEGYETIIGDRGVKLSGGQRQRLSIARAILRNPPILLLDEATSALDTEAEQLVQEAIDNLVRHRTTIVIAHRLSTIQNVDRIYLLEEGRVVQVGTHAELLAAGGRYKELYTMQFQR